MTDQQPLPSRRSLRAAEVPAQRERPLSRRELRALEPPTHAGFEAGPLETPDAPFGAPAVFADAPVLPALPPLPEFAEPQRPVSRPAVEEALRALLESPAPRPTDATAAAQDPATSTHVVELAVRAPAASLAERIAALPVAPGVIDIQLQAIPHPAEPLDNRLARPAAAPPEARPARSARPGPAATAAALAASDPPVLGELSRGPRRSDSDRTDLLRSGRRAEPRQARWAMWFGLAALVLWPVGPVAIALGAWTATLARRVGASLLKPAIGLLGGLVGTVTLAVFLLFWS